MAHITVAEANAWLESTKLNVSSIDTAVEGHASQNILSRLASVFDTSTWINETLTPKLVRTLISMYYVSYIYDRVYADDGENTSNYAFILRRNADFLIGGLLNGSVVLEEIPDVVTDLMDPVFFPNDQSSLNEPSDDFPSDGPPAFTMGQVF